MRIILLTRHSICTVRTEYEYYAFYSIWGYEYGKKYNFEIKKVEEYEDKGNHVRQSYEQRNDGCKGGDA